jgi:hypothetical protein
MLASLPFGIQMSSLIKVVKSIFTELSLQQYWPGAFGANSLIKAAKLIVCTVNVAGRDIIIGTFSGSKPTVIVDEGYI